MKVLVLTSCTGKKRVSGGLTLSDFQLGRRGIPSYRAQDLYTGRQHQWVMRGVREFGEGVSLWIVSAGYGLLSGSQKIASYNVSMQQAYRSPHLKDLPKAVKKLLSSSAYDLGMVLLGMVYLRVCQLFQTDWQPSGPLLVLGGEEICGIPDSEKLFKLRLGVQEAAFCHEGLVGLKGKVAHRILSGLRWRKFGLQDLWDAPDLLGLLFPPRKLV